MKKINCPECENEEYGKQESQKGNSNIKFKKCKKKFIEVINSTVVYREKRQILGYDIVYKKVVKGYKNF